ncbi:hypothetical protein AVEN_180693-1 [Araneus ventricosus]|uniref:Uncharacterized protein n=1 Tax=Araneus ventricosus TaxID=182803 RepID=A0A4Y1ZQX7_ARAVE|nr:hypothetical protein AVEN_180693-1 [Araneus ventricosus]
MRRRPYHTENNGYVREYVCADGRTMLKATVMSVSMYAPTAKLCLKHRLCPYLIHVSICILLSRSGFVVRSWIWGQRFKVRSSIPMKIRRVWDFLHAKSDGVTKRHPAGVVPKFRDGDRGHLSMVQQDEVRPKIAIVFLQNGMLL